MKKYSVKILKYVGYFILFILGLFLVITLALQVPAVQNFAKDKAVAYLEKKIKTKVRVDRIELGLPKYVILEGVYVEDKSKRVLLSTDKLKVDISLFKLMDNIIEINSVEINNLTSNIYKNKDGVFNFDYIVKAFATPPKPEDNSPPMVFSIDKIKLDLIKFTYIDDVANSKIKVNVKHFDTDIKTFDLQEQLIEINDFNLENSSIAFDLGKSQQIVKQDIPASQPSNWKFIVDETNFKNINFDFNDANSVAVKKGIDYKHLSVKNLSLEAEKLNYTSDIISGKIKSLAVNEKSGLEIQKLTTDFYYGKNEAFLKNLYLKTPNTLIQNQIALKYKSLDDLSKNLADLDLNVNFDNSQIAVKDILIFVPTLAENKIFANNSSSQIKINSKLNGKLNDLSIPNFEMSGIGSTVVNFSGRIIGFPDFTTSTFQIVINEITTTSKDIYSFVPKNTIPNTIVIPQNISLKGNFAGKLDDFKTNLSLASSFGKVVIKNGVFNNRRKNRERFIAQTEFYDFNLGKLIKNKSIGKISLKANVDGTGFDMKTSNTKIEGKIAEFDYNNYNFRNLNLKGNINGGLYNIVAKSADTNLKFDLVSNGGFRNKYPNGKLKLDIAYADLQKINVYNKPMKLRGIVNADIQTADADFLNGKISLDKFTIANEKDQFVLDSITIVAVSSAKNKSLKLKSQFANASIIGNYKLSEVGAALQNSISNYYELNPKNKNIRVEKQDFVFNVLIKDSPILYKLVPDLKSYEPITLAGRYNSINDTIIINGNIPKLIYGTNNITNAIIKVNKVSDSLIYNFFIDDFQTAQFQLPHTTLAGKIANNVVNYNLQIKDLKNEEKYYIAGKLSSVNSFSEIILDPRKLLLNYEKWELSADNKIRFGNSQLFVNNLSLSKTGNALTIQSQNQQANAPVVVTFKDFQIATILNIVQKKETQIDGRINGNVILKDIFKTPLFTSALTVDDFVYNNAPVGNLSVNVANNQSNVYNAKIALSGLENNLLLEGKYKSENSTLDMVLNIEKLNLKSLEGFTAGNIKESTGFLSGKLDIDGPVSKPLIIGELQFNEIAFTATELNAKFQSINDKIVFTTNEISLNKFRIKDEKNNDLVIDGTINSTDFSNLGFNLSIDAVNFNAVNSKEKDNDLFYGTLFLDNHLRVKGTMQSPIIDGSIKINKDTEFTLVLPQNDPSIADREGIVEFIDQDSPKLAGTIEIDKKLSQTEIKGINASVNIEIDKEAALSMIIDKANGDFLKLKGEARLTGGIDQSGKTTLTGRYDLTEGSYEMSFNLIKRKFDIKKGSYLMWTGEPTSATVDITAVYKLEAAPIDLLNDQLGTLNAATRNTYKQRIPFETELKMNGELLKPTISFNIVLPDGNNSVSTEIINATQAKLAQLRQEPDELNKQVFALLLLNRFIGENPFASESGGTTAQGVARESASKILSQQLNNLAGDLIKGVELNFDLDATEDYTTGKKENRTDLNIGLSKTLLNDRLKVTVGSSFGLEGPKQENENQSTIAGDLAADYQLTKDGRYKVRAYRKNRYQVALQGQVVETGVGFIITIDYDKFRELFQKAKK